jgi:hypothetical protein
MVIFKTGGAFTRQLTGESKSKKIRKARFDLQKIIPGRQRTIFTVGWRLLV